MKMPALRGWAAALAWITVSGAAQAAWPDDKPVEIYVGFAAGGSTDVMIRTLAPYVQKHLGGKAQLVVVNKPGASGSLAVGQMQRAQPDGYTLAVVNLPGYFFLPMQRRNPGYDPDSIELVARIVSDPTVLVARKDKGPATLAQAVERLKAKPGSLSAGHNGVGTNGHLAMMRLQKAAGVQFTAIPFKGTAEQRTNLGGGHIDLAFVAASEVQNQEAVPLQRVAQFVPERVASLPEVPTTFESGWEVAMTAERGLAMPQGVPADVASRLRQAVQAAMADPAYLRAARVDAPFLAYLDGGEWERRIGQERELYRSLAEEVKE